MSSKIKKIIACASMLVMLPVASFAATGTVDGNAVRLRKEPSSEARIITLLEKGKTGEILEEVDGWYKVTVGASTGWVSSDYFKKDDAAVVVNAVNEVAVGAFLDGRISFLDIGALIEKSLDYFSPKKITSYEDVVNIDAEAREFAMQNI